MHRGALFGNPALAQAKRLQKLIRANQALAQVESIRELLPLLLRLAQDVTNAEASSILLFNPEEQCLEFALAMNDTEGAAERILETNFRLKLGEGIAGHVALIRKPLVIADAQSDDRFFCKADEVSGFTTRTLLCVPILHKDELLGVVQVLNAKDKRSFDDEDLELLESFCHLAAVALVRSRLLEALLDQERLRTQLDAAATIQSNFFPRIPELPDGSHVWAVTRPAIFVGGDCYDVIPLGDGSVLFYVADVSGKGLPAALVGTALWSRIRSLSSHVPETADLLEALATDMYGILGMGVFITVALGRYWPASGQMSLCVAGHVPPLFCRADGAQMISQSMGLPLGIDPDLSYDAHTLRLEPGDSLLLLTDGVTEARNRQGEFYGEERLLAFLDSGRSAPRGLDLMREVDRWFDGFEANDDVTLMEIWRE